jgi:hypothetical protein
MPLFKRVKSRIKAELHRTFDPIVAYRRAQNWRQTLNGLADGEYCLNYPVPYISQFASPERINDYIHHGYHGLNDPRWPEFGSPEPEAYVFWAPRICALACLKMAIEAYETTRPAPSLWQLVQEGLDANGYILYDSQGYWRDAGWYVQAQVEVARRYGLTMTGYSYADPLGICASLRQNKLVAATVSPEIGEREAKSRRYGGHLILVTGFRWAQGRPTAFRVHNPSGRYPELQAEAWVAYEHFRRAYAYRFATYETS